MQIKGLLHDIPHLPILDCKCPICMQIKAPKLNRILKSNKNNNWTRGQCFHLDFAFINKPSVRGFTSYLTCDCVLTKYPYRFLTRSKRAPIDIIRWIIRTLKL